MLHIIVRCFELVGRQEAIDVRCTLAENQRDSG
jgi:hypothetical protein